MPSKPPVPHAVWSGSFRLFGVDVKCYVLDNGERIIEADSFHAVLEAMGSGAEIDTAQVEAFTRWQRGDG